MKDLQNYLESTNAPADLVSVMMSLARGVKRISDAFAKADRSKTGKAGTENMFGEEQLALDILADKMLTEQMDRNEHVGLIASEEQDGTVDVGDGKYAVCYDPLDGSSLVDVNLSVGSIIGVYETDDFIGRKGDEQVAAMIAVYGPRTTIMLTVKEGVVEFLLTCDGTFILNGKDFQVGEGKMFAPGNLRACKSRSDYLELVNFWIKNEYKLRYSGGMVPDINQIILKGKGIFTYPGFDEQPDGKLRLLVECAPMALLIEQAGGAASDGKMRILEKPIQDIAQRTPVYIGSKKEVARCEELMG